MPKKYSSEEGYDKYASFYDKKLKFLGSFEDGAIENLVSDLSGKSMLDVGSGTGRVLDMLKDKNMLAKAGSVHALDISGEMLKILKRKHPKVEAEKGDVQNMPYKDESFDIVVAAFVIVHLKSLEEFFDEAQWGFYINKYKPTQGAETAHGTRRRVGHRITLQPAETCCKRS